MLGEARGRPDDASIRRALVRWGFNTKQRPEPPAEVAEILAWVARNTTPLSALAEAATARRMLDQATGRAQQPSGPRLVAFFAVMYYAGLRPGEAINLYQDNVVLPPQVWDEDRHEGQDPAEAEDWGELHLRAATPDAGSEWTTTVAHGNGGSSSTGRRETAVWYRTHPELTWLLRRHLATFGTAPDGRLFSGVRGGELPTITCRRAWVRPVR